MELLPLPPLRRFCLPLWAARPLLVRLLPPEAHVSGYRPYQPPLTPELVHQLWLLKQRTHRPMTVLLREAIEWYLAENEGREVLTTPGPLATPTRQERRSS